MKVGNPLDRILLPSIEPFLDAYEDLRNILFSDSAVAGEACGYAMGLVMLGSASERALDEMMQYAHETAHEKIIRGLSLGIAFMFYGRQEQADKVIDQMLADKVRFIFTQLALRTHAGARITFFDMEGCIPSLLRMLAPQTTRPFVNFCTWLSPIRRMMFEERPSHPLRFSYSRIRAKFPV